MRSANGGRRNQRNRVKQEGGPGPSEDPCEEEGTVHRGNTRSSSGSRSIRPAQNQQAGDHPDRRQHRELTERGLVGTTAVADRQPGRGHAERDEQHEASGEAHPGLSGPGVLAVAGVLPSILGQVREAAVDIGAAELVGDEEGLARGVARGVGELGPQGGEAPFEVGGQEPLPLRGGERRPQLLGAVHPDLEQGLRDRPADRGRQDAQLLDHPGPRVLGQGPAVQPALPVGGDGERGGEEAADEGREGGAEQDDPERRTEHEHHRDHRGELADRDGAEAGLGQPVGRAGYGAVWSGAPAPDRGRCRPTASTTAV